MERIVNRTPEGDQYRVKWKKFKNPTWEPVEHLTGVQHLLDKFDAELECVVRRAIARSVGCWQMGREAEKEGKGCSSSEEEDKRESKLKSEGCCEAKTRFEQAISKHRHS